MQKCLLQDQSIIYCQVKVKQVTSPVCLMDFINTKALKILHKMIIKWHKSKYS